MARDLQAALVALNRFGFGARGGASGDLINASSDPRGFVKAELGRPNGVLLEAPGLQSTPQLGRAVFAYQDQVKQARDAAAKAGAPIEAQPTAEQKPVLRRNLSLNAAATEIAGQMAEAKPADNAAKPDTMQPNAAAPPAAKPALSRSTSSRRPSAPRRWRACSARRWPPAASPSVSSRSGPTISAFPRPRASWRGSGPARSSARRSARMCSDALATC